MTIAIIENESLWIEEIYKILKESISEVEIEKFENAETFFQHPQEFDVVFFDIDLGDGMTGVEASRIYKRKYPQKEKVTVLLTSLTEYAIEGYKSGAIRFVDKSNLENGIKDAIVAIKEIRESGIRIEIHALGNKKAIEILLDEILYVEKQNRQTHVVTIKKAWTTSDTLADLWQMTQSNGSFIYINRSQIVNMKNIMNYDYKNEVKVLNGDTLFVSRRKRDDFKQRYFDWQLERSML